MKFTLIVCALLLAVAAVTCSPIEKREAAADDLSPLNEVSLSEQISFFFLTILKLNSLDLNYPMYNSKELNFS